MIVLGTNNQLESIVLGGGCFWCIEAVYLELQGVVKVESGYAGGQTKNPSYQEVCGGDTGHAEVCKVTFDPSIISLQEILEIFFTVHDPTTLNRQGNDVGEQYRSIILYSDEKQKNTASKNLQEANKTIYEGEIVTTIEPLEIFYKAEQYHQNFYARNPNQGYCRVIISPKVAKFRKKYFEKLKNKEITA